MANDLLILTEGFITDRGLARRDLEAMVQGLVDEIAPDSLHDQRHNVAYLGEHPFRPGIPIVERRDGGGIDIGSASFGMQSPLGTFPVRPWSTDATATLGSGASKSAA